MTYTQLTQGERYQIHALQRQGFKVAHRTQAPVHLDSSLARWCSTGGFRDASGDPCRAQVVFARVTLHVNDPNRGRGIVWCTSQVLEQHEAVDRRHMVFVGQVTFNILAL